MAIKVVGLALSSACGAKCVFCPITERGACNTRKLMPFRDAKKVIDEVANNPELRATVETFKTGEGGDSLINPEYLKVVRYIREVLPEKKIILHNNFQFLNKEICDALIDEKLIDNLTCNIDGADKEHYEVVKGIPFEVVMKNLMYFFEKRKSSGVKLPLEVYSLSYGMYIAQISSGLGVIPLRATPEDVEKWGCDYFKVLEMLSPHLDPTDCMMVGRVFGWAEREQFKNAKIDYRMHTCPCVHKDELETHAYIASDGDWYICCWDNKNEIVFGNVFDTSLAEVMNGERRQKTIQLIKDKKFGEVGGPCSTVNCCDMRVSSYVVERTYGYLMPMWWDSSESAADFVNKNWYK